MKCLGFIIALAATLVTFSAFSWDRFEIKRDSHKTNPYSTDIEMRKKFDYDPSNKYRGSIDKDGYVRMRNYDGNSFRGTIDSDSSGTLRDQDGNTYRVRPR